MSKKSNVPKIEIKPILIPSKNISDKHGCYPHKDPRYATKYCDTLKRCVPSKFYDNMCKPQLDKFQCKTNLNNDLSTQWCEPLKKCVLVKDFKNVCKSNTKDLRINKPDIHGCKINKRKPKKSTYYCEKLKTCVSSKNFSKEKCKVDRILFLTGNFKDKNGCIQGIEEFDEKTKKCKKITKEVGLFDLNQNKEIISEEASIVTEEESIVTEEESIVTEEESIVTEEESIVTEEEPKKVIKKEETLQDKYKKLLQPPKPVIKDKYGCESSLGPKNGTHYCKNSGQCEKLDSYNHKNNLCDPKNVKKYQSEKENNNFKIALLVVGVLIIIIIMLFWLNHNLNKD